MLRKFLPLLVFGFLALISGFAMFLAGSFGGFSSDVGDGGALVAPADAEEDFQSQMRRKLNEVRIPELDLENATLEEAIETIVKESYDHSPTGGGFGFVIRYPKVIGAADDVSGYRDGISLSMENVGIAEALDLAVEQAGAQWKINEFSKIEILPKNWVPKWKVVPEFGFDEDDPFSDEDDPFG